MANAYYENPAEGALREGGKASTAIADVGALTSAQLSPGATATDHDDSNKIQADVATIRTKVNALLAANRTAGLLTP